MPPSCQQTSHATSKSSGGCGGGVPIPPALPALPAARGVGADVEFEAWVGDSIVRGVPSDMEPLVSLSDAKMEGLADADAGGGGSGVATEASAGATSPPNGRRTGISG